VCQLWLLLLLRRRSRLHLYLVLEADMALLLLECGMARGLLMPALHVEEGPGVGVLARPPGLLLQR
jgi:hypothetical protein